MGAESMEQQQPPVLTDGVVTLRPWRDSDIEVALRGHDGEAHRWIGEPDSRRIADAPREAAEAFRAGELLSLVIEHEELPVGYVEVRRAADRTGELTWMLFAGNRGRGLATRALALLAEYAFDSLGYARLQAHVDPDDARSIRLATRAGMRREGTLRQGAIRAGEETGAAGRLRDAVVLARLADDRPLYDPAGFREILNAFLPRKRAISQLIVRDEQGRVLLCQLTYKRDWDLPGGVVEVGESPHLAAGREAEEELGVALQAGPLVLTDWLPPWGGWDDAVCLVFDGGIHDSSIVEQMVLEAKEIRGAQFCSIEQVRRVCADYTARRIEAALAALEGTGAPYTESGRAPGE
ncbi:NUDIX hydrolase [Hoyosella sp. G463]|uniref:NUDIX hydrolase n=1 Tax=Lolliginicoccus lacisalsi TaxID=2742202 RepID=A0A927JCS4_9ACTN|nr:NUDIX hydrolase [Lolliginicoccus lacisalsi]